MPVSLGRIARIWGCWRRPVCIVAGYRRCLGRRGRGLIRVFGSARERDINFLLGEVLGLKECYPLLQGRAGNGRVLEDWRPLASSRAGSWLLCLLTGDGRRDEILAHHLGYTLCSACYRRRQWLMIKLGSRELTIDGWVEVEYASAPLRRRSVPRQTHVRPPHRFSDSGRDTTLHHN